MMIEKYYKGQGSTLRSNPRPSTVVRVVRLGSTSTGEWNPGKGQWMPFQYFSSNCYLTFGRTESDSAFDLESEALCTSKHSKITPLTNGVVIFSTLRGRPSSNNYENSQILRDFTTAEKLRFTLVRHGFDAWVLRRWIVLIQRS